MIYPDMPIHTDTVWLIAFLTILGAGIVILAIYGRLKSLDVDDPTARTLVSFLLPIAMTASIVTAGALVYTGIVYDLLVEGAIIEALEDQGYSNVDLDGTYFTAMQGDNQVTAGLVPAGPGRYSVEVVMSGPTTLED